MKKKCHRVIAFMLAAVLVLSGFGAYAEYGKESLYAADTETEGQQEFDGDLRPYQNTEIVSCTPDAEKATDFFNTLKLEALTPEELAGEDTTAKLTFNLAVEINGECAYVQEVRGLVESIPESISGQEYVDEYAKIVTEEATTASAIKVTLTMDEKFQKFADTTAPNVTATLNGEESVILGTYEVSQGQVEINLSPAVYCLDNVTLQASFSMKSSYEGELDTTKNAQLAIVENRITANFLMPPVEPDPGADYTFSKEVIDADNFPYVTYEIKAGVAEDAAEDTTLDGLCIRDVVPDGLELAEQTVTVSGAALTAADAAPTEQEITITSSSAITQPPQPGEVIYQDNMLSYYIPADSKNISMKVKMRLNSASNIEYMSSEKQEYEKSFTNTAFLVDTEDSDKILKQQEATWDVPEGMRYFSKDGELTDDMQYTWTLKLNSFITRVGREYIVDHIADIENTHNYVVGEDAVTITQEGKGKVDYKLIDITKDSSYDNLTQYKYADYNNSMITGDYKENTFKSDLELLYPDGKINQNNTIYCYKYTTPDGKTDAVMVIPVKQFCDGGDCKLTVTYKTKVVENVINTDNGEYNTDNEMKHIRNDAKIIWARMYGPGPDPYEDFEIIGLEKDTVLNLSVVHKTAEGYKENDKDIPAYDEKTQILNWRFTFNHIKKTLSEITVTDVFEDEKCKLLLDENSKVKLVYGENSETILRYQESPDTDTGQNETTGTDASQASDGTATEQNTEDAGYFQIQKKDGMTTLTLHINSLTAADTPYITVPVQLLDTTILNTQSTELRVENTAKVTAKVGDVRVNDKEITGAKTLPNTYIQKDAYGYDTKACGYDYVNNAFIWKLTVNPNQLNIQNGVIYDILPEGSTFGQFLYDEKKYPSIASRGQGDAKITTGGALQGSSPADSTGTAADNQSIKFGNVTVTAASAKRSDITGAVDDSAVAKVKECVEADKLLNTNRPVEKFTFQGDESGESSSAVNRINSTYTIYYTTSYSQDSRKKLLEKMNGDKKTLTAENNCYLAGSYVNAENAADKNFIQGAKDSAEQEVELPPVKKYGTYYYKSNINVSDSNADIPYINWIAEINIGKINLAGRTLVDDIPSQYELIEESLQLYPGTVTADGKVVKKEGGAELTKSYIQAGKLALSQNKIQLTFDKTEDINPYYLTFDVLVTEDIDDENQMCNEMYFTDGTTQQFTTNTQVAKQSEVFDFEKYAAASTLPTIKVKKTTSNVTDAALASLAVPLQGAVFTLTDMTTQKVKTKTTSAAGVVNFAFLKRGVVYKLEEQTAPDGYQVDNSLPKYFMFNDTDTDIGALCNAEVLTQGDVTILGTNQKVETCIMKNTPAQSVTFQGKLEENPLPDTGYTLVPENNNLVEKQTTSTEGGTVTFEGVDPGTYQIKQNLTDEQKKYIEPLNPLKVTVEKDSVTFTGDNSQQTDDGNVVTNHKRTGAGMIRGMKYGCDKDGLKYPLANAVIGLYLPGGTLADRVTSGEDGSFVFDKVPAGDYFIKEIQAPDGYVCAEESLSVTVKEDGTILEQDIALVNQKQETPPAPGGDTKPEQPETPPAPEEDTKPEQPETPPAPGEDTKPEQEEKPPAPEEDTKPEQEEKPPTPEEDTKPEQEEKPPAPEEDTKPEQNTSPEQSDDGQEGSSSDSSGTAGRPDDGKTENGRDKDDSHDDSGYYGVSDESNEDGVPGNSGTQTGSVSGPATGQQIGGYLILFAIMLISLAGMLFTGRKKTKTADNRGELKK